MRAMSKPEPKPFRIFRVGTHVDSAGNETTFTREQLAATVKAYNEGSWRAPLVAGHPKGTAPAYGWIGPMRLDDQGEVWVDSIDDLNVDMAEAMKSKAYRNRSASWYHPEHPANPTPGVWQLRHLGLLGAQPPALKGLQDIEFSDGDGVVVEFADYTTSTIGYLFRSLRELIIAKWGQDEADKALPNFHIGDLEQAGRDRAAETTPNFTEEDTSMTPEEIAALKAQAARTAQLEADLAAANTARQAAEQQVTSYSEQQAKAARAIANCPARTARRPSPASAAMRKVGRSVAAANTASNRARASASWPCAACAPAISASASSRQPVMPLSFSPSAASFAARSASSARP
jgi:hypothetical protein